MKRTLLILLFTAGVSSASAQRLTTANKALDRAFELAVATLYDNTPDSLIKAGGEYGGEWTRDVSINAWNAASLLMPEKTRYSLWSVTTDDRTMIGHQYWDQIIWVTGTYDHYLETGDTEFLRQAYAASANTMHKLEKEAYDPAYGLFTGPSVFNDGIAGYEEPIYEPGNMSSYVLDHSGSKTIKCLSTNCIYYEAYKLLSRMATLTGDRKNVRAWQRKADVLRKNIRRHLYDAQQQRFNYLIDGTGTVHPHQEGLGIAFAVLFDVVTPAEARGIVGQVHVEKYGLPSVYPCFKRYSDEKPGRHNVLVWPFVNAFWAEACLKSGREDIFYREFVNLAELAVDKGGEVFWEIYNAKTGEVDGGWQCDFHWGSVHHQTWSATGFLRMVFRGALGMSFSERGMMLTPNFDVLNRIGFKELSGLRYQQGMLDIRMSGTGTKLAEVRVNGKVQSPKKQVEIPNGHAGTTVIEYVMK